MSTETDDEETVVCADGETRPASLCVEIDGDFYQSDSEDIILCDDDEWRLLEDCVETVNHGWRHRDECHNIPRNSREQRWYYEDDEDIVCCHDGEYRMRDDCTYVECEGEYYHYDEVFHCEHCENSYPDSYSSHMVTNRRGYEQTWCETCFHEDGFCCESCGECFHNDHYNEGCYCNDCAGDSEEEPEDQGGIECYSCRKSDRLQPESTDKQLLGYELEVVSRNGSVSDAVKFVRQHLATDYVTLKSDGSICGPGFEIVSRPDSLAVHKKKTEAFLAEAKDHLKSWPANLDCGMHVHITRSALSPLQLGKMLVFLNDPGNERFVTDVAGRGPIEWCKRSPKKLTDGIKRSDERRAALNLTNDRTVEVRIFRGNVARDGFIKNLEFVQALVDFTAPAEQSIGNSCRHDEFCKWLNPKQYPTLHAFLLRKGYGVKKINLKKGEDECA